MPERGVITNRLLAYAIMVLFVGTLFVQLAPATDEIRAMKLKNEYGEGIHIDLNFYDDPFSSTDSRSDTELKTIELKKTDHNSFLSIESYDRRVGLSPVQILELNQTNTPVLDTYTSILIKESATPSNRISYSKGGYDIRLDNTISGIKETIVINSPPDIDSDLVIRTRLSLDEKITLPLDKHEEKYTWLDRDSDISIKDDKYDIDMFRISEPVLISSPETVKMDRGDVGILDTVIESELRHRIFPGTGYLYYDIIVPKVLLHSDIVYPLYIDPSITTFSGYAEYTGYDNGSISYYNGATTTWYYNADRMVYLDSDITVGTGESLIFNNVIVKANKTSCRVDVSYNGTFCLHDRSNLTKSDGINGYTLVFDPGSIGRIINSTVEHADYAQGIEVKSSDVYIYNSTFRYSDPYGVYINQSIPKIFNSNFYRNGISVYVSSFSDPILVGNRINNSDYGVLWDSSNVFDDLSDSTNLEKLIGTQLGIGKIEYDYGEENLAETCPTLSVDSHYDIDKYPKERMINGLVEMETGSDRWVSGSTDPHWAIFDLGQEKNISKVKIFHEDNDGYELQDYLIQTWNSSSSNWETQLSVNDNSDHITTHSFSSMVQTQKVRLYITDSSIYDTRARVYEFEIYGRSFNSANHYALTKPFNVYGDSIFGELYLDKTEPGDSEILTSVLDGSTNETISGFVQNGSEVIDLKWINVSQHPSIKIKAEFVKDASNYPTLDKLRLYYSNLRSQTVDFDQVSDLSITNNIHVQSGHACLNITDVTIDEQWDSAWESNWTVNEEEDGGDADDVQDFWSGSGYDLYLEGKSLTAQSGHTGTIEIKKYLGEVDVNCTLQTHFYGKIDDSVYNLAEFLIILHNNSNTSYRMIRWTTRDAQYDEGLDDDNDTYYIVAQNHDPCPPYEYDENINTRLTQLFDSYFGEGQINYSIYKYLEVKAWSIEPWNEPLNPQVYIDYFTVSNVTTSGTATTNSFSLETGTSWSHLAVNKDAFLDSDVKLTLLDTYSDSSISGYSDLGSNIVDISPLNGHGITSFKVQFSLGYGIYAPRLDWIKVYSAPWFQNNTITSNIIGIKINDSLPLIRNNTIGSNSLIGIHLWERRNVTLLNDTIQFIITENDINDNYLGLFMENTTAWILDNDIDENDISLRIHNSSVVFDQNILSQNQKKMYINRSIVEFDNCRFTQSSFSFEFTNSKVTFDGCSFNNNNNEQVVLVWSELIFIDSRYYDELSQTIDSHSIIYCNWSYSISASGTDQNPSDHREVSFYDCDDNLWFSDYTDDEGEIEGSLCEQVIKDTGTYYKTPTYVEFEPDYPETDPFNHFYLNMIQPQYHSIQFGFDSDGDSISDEDEMEPGKYIFECEYLVDSSKVNDSGAFQKESGDSNIVPINIHVSEADPNMYYSLALRAKYYAGDSCQRFRVTLNDMNGFDEENFFVTPIYSWYQTDWFQMNNPDSPMTGSILDLGGGGEVVVDKFMLLMNPDPSLNNPPTLCAPLIPDIDDDDLEDGYERTPTSFYLEAEYYAQSPSASLYETTSAVNSKCLELDYSEAIQFIVDSPTSSTDYLIYVRAKDNESSYVGRFEISKGISSQESPDLNNTFCWHVYRFTLDQGSNIVDIQSSVSSSQILIDRIRVLRRNDISLQESGPNVQIPTWGIVKSANVTYTADNNNVQYSNPNIGSITCLDSYLNLTVYSGNQNTKGYNISTGEVYNIDVDGIIDSYDPVISKGEVAFLGDPDGNYSGDIYYSDLRRGPNNIENVIISNEDSVSYIGNETRISDGTVVWFSNTDPGNIVSDRIICSRFMDSWHFIKFEEENNHIMQDKLNIYTRTVVWISTEIIGLESYDVIRSADLGIFADLQEDSIDDPGLQPHIHTVETALEGFSFEQVDVYQHRIAYLEYTGSDYNIKIYDNLTDTISNEYSSPNIMSDQPVFIWGDYLCWAEEDMEDYILKIKEIGQVGTKTVYQNPTIWGSYSLYGGRVFYSTGTALNGYVQESYIEVTDQFQTSTNKFLAQSEHVTSDFANDLNEYKSEIQQSFSYSYTDYFAVEFNTGGQYGSLVIEDINIRYYGITDSFTYDFDGDGILDRDEQLSYYNRSLFETEDTYDFKEWIEPKVADSSGVWQGYSAMTYDYSPIFHGSGCDLITGDYPYDEEGPEYLWVNSTSYLEYDLPNVGGGKTYRIESVPNENVKNAYDDFDDFPFDIPMPSQSRRVSEWEMMGSTGPDLIQEPYQLNDTELNYIYMVLDNIIQFNFNGYSDDEVEVLSDSRDYLILDSRIGKSARASSYFYDTTKPYNELALVVELDYTGEINFCGPGNYKMEIRADLDLLPDELRPLLKDSLGERSLVPDGFEIERFRYIRIVNLDYFVVLSKDLDPVYRDTDNDGLTDYTEADSRAYPLSEDPDRDGLSDLMEVNVYHTYPDRRDTDGDCIRDAVELSIPQINLVTLQSRGSWFERKARNGNYFDLAEISNQDANLMSSTLPTVVDSDGDGLPDGWADGWTYYGRYVGGSWDSFYSSKWWRFSYNWDCMIQVWEGEDLNFDGDHIGGLGNWDFDGVTFEYTGDGTGETDPMATDTDSDGIPDGYEVWYGTKESFVDSNGYLIMSPTNNLDNTTDLDPNGYAPFFYTGSAGNNSVIIDGTTVEKASQDIVGLTASQLKMVSRIGVLLSGPETGGYCLEIWSSSSSQPVTLIHSEYEFVETEQDPDGLWFIYDVPQGIFYNGINGVNYQFSIAMSYGNTTFEWIQSSNSQNPSTYSYSSGSWSLTVNQENLMLRFESVNFTNAGDDLSNLEEYIVGTDPKCNNSDAGEWEEQDDKLLDGQEVKTYKPGGLSGEVLLRTDIDQGALYFHNLYNGGESGKHLWYNEDPMQSGGDFYIYDYVDKGDQYTFTSWEYVHSLSLRDGSLITRVTESSDIYLIFWDTIWLELDDYWEDGLGNKYINNTFIRFERTGAAAGSFNLDLAHRGDDVYFSDPCRRDTDNDLILDGLEINWNYNSDGSYTGWNLTNLGTDLVYNVRDKDSDNDGADDGKEVNYDIDLTGQGLDVDSLENMIDPDSDEDGLYDGWEPDYRSDPDHDGLMNMEDPDSDNDGLCDGYREGYIWDPQANSRAGLFVECGDSTTYNVVNTGSADYWEGEDQDNDSVRDSLETDPLSADSDQDGLYDGYDYYDKINDKVYRGEQYEQSSTEMDGINEEGPDFVYIRTYGTNEQDDSTDPLDWDTDDDSLYDGNQEVFSYGEYRCLFIRVPTESGIENQQFTDITSDPSLADTDSDSLDDDEEYSAGTLPYDSDSDNDGIDDNYEAAESSVTLPNNCDTDDDQLPDGGVDGWWVDSSGDGYYDSGKTSGGSLDYWEGEDRSNFGTISSSETYPNNKDSDGDGLMDFHEYFYYLQDIGAFDFTDPTPSGVGSDVDSDGYINPRDADLDGDGLSDGEEDCDKDGELDATVGSHPDNPTYESAKEPNPFDFDSDDDGVPDGSDSPYNTTNGTVMWRGDHDNDGLINSMDQDSDDDGLVDNSMAPSGDQYPLDKNNGGDTNTEYQEGYGDPDNDDDGIEDCYEDTNENGVYDSGDDSDLNDADTDEDGLDDWEERFYGTDPKSDDSDSDGLDDYEEIYDYGTDPKIADTDGDGLSDGTEENSYGTDPLDADSDDDGLTDGRPKEANLDSDNDGIINALETDSDDDGISDYSEEYIYFLDSTDSDYDDDGLTDGFEILSFFSNPRIINTDGPIESETRNNNPDRDFDELSDLEEYYIGTDPDDADSDDDLSNDGLDFEPLIPNCEILFTIRELILLDKVDENEGDLFIMAECEAEFDWGWSNIPIINKGWFYNNIPEQYNSYIVGYEYWDNPESIFNWKDDDGEEYWKDDQVKTRNEMVDRFSLCTKGLNNKALKVKFHIGIYDADNTYSSKKKPDMIDISPVENADTEDSQIYWFDKEKTKGRALDVTFDLRTSSWYVEEGEDILEGRKVIKEGNEIIFNTVDANGMGVCSGLNDADFGDSTSIDATISFDIFPIDLNNYKDGFEFLPGDIDHDKLTTYSEYHYYNTEFLPYDLNLGVCEGYDTDSDGLMDWFEIRYRDDCLLNPNDPFDKLNYDEIDEDGITIINEQEYYIYGSNPLFKDIFVEVDWMKETSGKEYKFPENSQNKVIKRFGKHSICLHIDDGCMGGGGSLNKYDSKFSDTIETQLKNNNYGTGSNKGFTPGRKHIFHYFVIADKNNKGSSTAWGFGEYMSDFAVQYGGTVRASDQAHNFMHELGHNILGAYVIYTKEKSWALPKYHNPDLKHFVGGDPTFHDLDDDGKKDVWDHSKSDSDAMKSGGHAIVEYEQKTWDAIKLAKCLE